MDKEAHNLSAQIKSRLLVSQVVGRTVKLRKTGGGLLGLCPFHEEKTPSFNVRDTVGRFKCFGCGASGDVFEFLMRLRGISFVEAVKELADECGLSSPGPVRPRSTESVILSANRAALQYFRQNLFADTGQGARRYLLEQRGLSEIMIRQARLGFGGSSLKDLVTFLKKAGVSQDAALRAGLLAERSTGELTHIFKDRVMFPIVRADGAIIAFGARRFIDDDSPKYLNTKTNELFEKTSSVYGLFESKNALLKGKRLAVVEGYFDALAFWAAGIPAVAICGTAINHKHVQSLKKFTKNVDLAFDNDFAGSKGLQAALAEFFKEGIFLGYIDLDLPDPGTYLDQRRLPELKAAGSKPRDAMIAAIDRAAEQASGDIHKRIQGIESLLSVFLAIQSPIVKRQYVAYVAQVFHEDPAVLWKMVSRASGKHVPTAKTNSPISQRFSPHEELLLTLALGFPDLLESLPLEAWTTLSTPIARFLQEMCKLNKACAFDYASLHQSATAINQNFAQAFLELWRKRNLHGQADAQSLFQALVGRIAEEKQRDELRKMGTTIRKAEASRDVEELRRVLKLKSELLKQQRQHIRRPEPGLKPSIATKSSAPPPPKTVTLIPESNGPIESPPVMSYEEDWF